MPIKDISGILDLLVMTYYPQISYNLCQVNAVHKQNELVQSEISNYLYPPRFQVHQPEDIQNQGAHNHTLDLLMMV